MSESKRGSEGRARARGGRAADAVRPVDARRRRRASSSGRGATTAAREEYPLAEIVARLHHHRQRATYEAVGGLRNAPAVRVRGWFARRETPENSFVVSRLSGEPTRYPLERLHPRLKTREAVLESADALLAWLREHPLRRR